jgi:hypothetical protein
MSLGSERSGCRDGIEQGRTRKLIEAIIAARRRRRQADVVVLSEHSVAIADGTRPEQQPAATHVVLEAIEGADVVAIGKPICRGSSQETSPTSSLARWDAAAHRCGRSR